VYYHGPQNTGRELRRIVGVVPAGSVELGLEPVCEAMARSNRALTGTRDTVLPGRRLLQLSVPVQCRAFEWIADIVVDRDLEPVSPVRLHRRSGVLPVDEDHITKDTVRRNLASANREVVAARYVGDRDVVCNRCIRVIDCTIATPRDRRRVS